MILVRCEFVNFNIFLEIMVWFVFEIRIMNVKCLKFQIILHNFTIAFLQQKENKQTWCPGKDRKDARTSPRDY